MPLTRDLVEALTPPIHPPTPPPETDGIRREGASLRRWEWTQYLRTYPGFDFFEAFQNAGSVWHVGIGLIPVHELKFDIVASREFVDAVYESGYIWGAVIFATSETEHSSTVINPSLNFETGTFPIVVHSVSNQPQVLAVRTSSGAIGTASCFAERHKDNFPASGKKGVLSAGHVIGSMTSGFDICSGSNCATAQVGVHSPPCLDAVFIESNWGIGSPKAFSPLSHLKIAAGDPTEFRGISSAHVSGFVTHFAPHPRYTGSGVPMILCHDGLGQAGDSGALVEVNGQNAAMHLSRITLNSGGQESRTILLEQLAHVMKLNLYD